MLKEGLRKKWNGYTLLEVMLSMAILSIVVYSVFLVFDRTMEVMDDMFVDTHRYEQVRQFFDRLSTELSTMTVGESSGTPHYFHGGPHWLEFSTPLIKPSDTSADLDSIMSEYIRSSSQGITKQYSRVMYYSARPSDNRFRTQHGWLRDLFTHHVFRLVQVSASRADMMAGLDENSLAIIEGSVTDEVPTWLDDLGSIKLAKSSSASLLAGRVNISEALSCRAVKFRYHYKVIDDSDNIYNFTQDWWDSRLKYPSYNTSGTSSDFITFVENNEQYNLYQPIAEERERRYFYPEKETADPVRTDPDFSFCFNDSWLYEGEPDTFVPFEGKSANKVLPSEASGINDYAELKASSLSPEADPWFQSPPEVVEVTVYLLDRKMTTFPHIRFGSGTRQSPPFDTYSYDQLAREFRGEVYSMKIYIRTSSSSVTHFTRDVLTE